MYQRIAPKSNRNVQAIALPMDSDDFGPARQETVGGYSFYPWTVAVRLGLLGVLLFNAFAFWFS